MPQIRFIYIILSNSKALSYYAEGRKA